MGAQPMLFSGLLEDAVVSASDPAGSQDAVERHLGYRNAWFSEVVGRLVVPDRRLAEVGRRVPGGVQVETTVLNTGGAGGLVALAGRTVPGITVAAVESPLRDLDDLAGNAERVVAAAAELGDDVDVYVGLPYAPGWQAAVELVEAAGLFGKIRMIDGAEPGASATQLAEQLKLLVEADLPFAVAGLNRALPQPDNASTGPAAQPYGFLAVLAALDALIEGAQQGEAVEILSSGVIDRIVAMVDGWNSDRQQRIRRRIRCLDSESITAAIDDLVALGVLNPS